MSHTITGAPADLFTTSEWDSEAINAAHLSLMAFVNHAEGQAPAIFCYADGTFVARSSGVTLEEFKESLLPMMASAGLVKISGLSHSIAGGRTVLELTIDGGEYIESVLERDNIKFTTQGR
jgi:hypothetical protein